MLDAFGILRGNGIAQNGTRPLQQRTSNASVQIILYRLLLQHPLFHLPLPKGASPP